MLSSPESPCPDGCEMATVGPERDRLIVWKYGPLFKLWINSLHGGNLSISHWISCPKESATISNQIKILIGSKGGPNGKQPQSVSMTAVFHHAFFFLVPQPHEFLPPLGIPTLTTIWIRAGAVTSWSIACLNTGKSAAPNRWFCIADRTPCKGLSLIEI